MRPLVVLISGKEVSLQEGWVGQGDGQRSRQEESVGWFVFFVSGRVVYAADHNYGQMKRLRDYLRRYDVVDQLKYFNDSAIATNNNPEYAYLWLLLEKNILNPAQARTIISCMVQETLFELLNLRQGTFTFELGNALDPPMISFEIGALITQITKQVQEWKQFHPHIQSPDQVMVITDEEKLQSTLSENLYQRLIFGEWKNLPPPTRSVFTSRSPHRCAGSLSLHRTGIIAGEKSNLCDRLPAQTLFSLGHFSLRASSLHCLH